MTTDRQPDGRWIREELKEAERRRNELPAWARPVASPPECPTCGKRQWPVIHSCTGIRQPETSHCWAMADDENPDCPIGSARCVRPAGHEDEHVWEATP